MQDYQNYPRPQQAPYQQPVYQQPVQAPVQVTVNAPTPRRRPPIGWLALAVLTFFAGLAFGVGIGSSAHGVPASVTTQGGNTPAATQAPATPTKPLTWTTIQTFTGNGNTKTATFAAPDDWKLLWKCDPNSFQGMSYNLIVSVTNSDNTSADFAAINALCQSGSTSGSTEERQSGNVFLDIQSEGAWTITVQALK